MGTKPRQDEYVNRLVLDKERAIYWVCALLERDGAATREAARAALAQLGYDQRRVESMLHLGEPGRRGAGEILRTGRPYDDDRQRTGRRRPSGRSSEPAPRQTAFCGYFAGTAQGHRDAP
jgi:hypothetical protein